MKMCLLVGATLVLQPVVAVGQQPATKQRYQSIDYDAPPASLEALWDETPVVARVRIEDADTRQLPSAVPDVPGTVITVHDAVVLEVLKGGDIKEGGTITVAVPVGTLPATTKPAIVARSTGMRKFVRGEELLVFLKWWNGAGAYNVSFGPVGQYELSSDAVALPAASSKWQAFARLGSAARKQDFLATVRSLKNRPPKEPDAR